MLLYIHIPFCHRVCPYCSFYKHTPGNTSIGDFIDALATEAGTRIPPLESPRTIYLGGGTPSMLSPAHLIRLFQSLHRLIDFSTLDEVTMEANPATFDRKKAALIRDLGVTRVSLGIQSFTPHVLKILGREHDPQQATTAVHTLRAAEIASVNIDLMFSIPGQSLDDWKSTLHHAIALQPDHISAYNLTYEEDTDFFHSLRSGKMRENEDDDADHFHLADELLTAAGFDHYETSNYGRPGHHSSHNRGYWRGEEYVGLGPSAVSTINGIRTKNVPDTAAYISLVTSLGRAPFESEALDAEALRVERIALGLRTREGISLELLPKESRARAAHLAAEGLIEITAGRITVVHHGRALVDSIAAELI